VGTGALYLGVKQPGRDADNSPPSNVEVKNAWSCTSTSPIRLNGVMLSYSTATTLPLPFTILSITALDPTQPPVQWVPGALFLRVKRPERGADHSPPSSAEFKNARRYTSTPPWRGA